MRLIFPYKSTQRQTNVEYSRQRFLSISEYEFTPCKVSRAVGSTVASEDLNTKLMPYLREIEEILLRLKVQDFVKKGFIRPAMKKVVAEIPPKFPGKPLSEYLKEIRE